MNFFPMIPAKARLIASHPQPPDLAASNRGPERGSMLCRAGFGNP
jgi:hypothetical protein